MGLIRGAAAITFEKDHNKDSERLHILISMTIWAIWKSRNNNTINNQDVVLSDAPRTLKELIQDLKRKGWNMTQFFFFLVWEENVSCTIGVMHFLEDGRRMTRQHALKTLWADGHLTKFDPKTCPGINSLYRDTGVGGF